MKIKDMFKYEKIVSLEIRLDCEHNIKCYLDFGDESPIIIIDEFSVTKKDGSSIFRTGISHLYSKKMKYDVKLRIEATCPQEAYKVDIADVGLRDLILIKKVKVPLESIIKKVRHLFESINMRKIKEFNAKDEDELLEQVILWPKFDKEWDKGWDRIEPNRTLQNKVSIIRSMKETKFFIHIRDPNI